MYIIKISKGIMSVYDYLNEFTIYSYFLTSDIKNAKRYNTIEGAQKARGILQKRTKDNRVITIEKI